MRCALCPSDSADGLCVTCAAGFRGWGVDPAVGLGRVLRCHEHARKHAIVREAGRYGSGGHAAQVGAAEVRGEHMRCTEPGCTGRLLYESARVETGVLHEVWRCERRRCGGGSRSQRSLRGAQPIVFDVRKPVDGEEPPRSEPSASAEQKRQGDAPWSFGWLREGAEVASKYDAELGRKLGDWLRANGSTSLADAAAAHDLARSSVYQARSERARDPQRHPDQAAFAGQIDAALAEVRARATTSESEPKNGTRRERGAPERGRERGSPGHPQPGDAAPSERSGARAANPYEAAWAEVLAWLEALGDVPVPGDRLRAGMQSALGRAGGAV